MWQRADPSWSTWTWKKFFDRVNHDILMSRLAGRIGDKRLLRRGVDLRTHAVCDRHEGTPQGGPLSPLLANLLLDDLDRELERRGHKFCRYADDCNIYVQSLAAGERVLASVTRYLEEHLKLRVNRTQSAVASGKLSATDAEAAFARTIELLDVPVAEVAYCPHPAFPVGCFCRKPLPGLGVMLIEKHGLAREELVVVGDLASDMAFATGLGARYVQASVFFQEAAS